MQEEQLPVNVTSTRTDLRSLDSNDRKLQSLISILKVGIRGSFFLRVRLDDNNATWSQLIAIILVNLVILFLGNLLHVGLSGEFSLYGLPGALFGLPVLLLLAWSLAKLAGQLNKTLLLLIAFSAIYLPFEAIKQMLQWLLVQNPVLHLGYRWYEFFNFTVIMWFAFACGTFAIRNLDFSLQKRKFAVFLSLLIIGLPTSQIYRNQDLWIKPYDRREAIERNKRQNLLVNEDVFYLQPKILERELTALKSSSKTGINLYFVGVAGYSSQDVFMKEIQFVNTRFKEHYGTDGHTVLLINNPSTVTQLPIASSTSLKMTLSRVGAVMDHTKDILFLYLTSHGSSDHKFSLNFGSMQFKDLDPKRLRTILDDSGIKRRIIIVSACYSGGFIEDLKSDDSLVITSSSADKTSFGCSNESVFTYFGKAYFDEALLKTNSFIDAFEIARPLISAREKADGYTPSEPRIYVGEAIKEPLLEFHRQQLARQTFNTVDVVRDAVDTVSNKQTEEAIIPSQKIPMNDRFKDALRLVTLMKYSEMLKDAIKLCHETASLQSPESLVKADPNYFKGITPKSILWPKVVSAYQAYYAETCNGFDVESYSNNMAVVYASKLRADELSSATNFYTSAAGQKLAATNRAASFAHQREMSVEMIANGERAEANFTKKISELAEINISMKTEENGKNHAWWKFFE